MEPTVQLHEGDVDPIADGRPQSRELNSFLGARSTVGPTGPTVVVVPDARLEGGDGPTILDGPGRRPQLGVGGAEVTEQGAQVGVGVRFDRR